MNITKYGKNVTFNLFNSFYSSFNQYSKLLNRNLDVEKDKNENEILKENKINIYYRDGYMNKITYVT